MNCAKRRHASSALCGAVASADGIESQNVVGYQEKAISAGLSLVTPMFQDIGKDGLDLKNLKLSATAAGDGTEVIQLLDSTGQNVGNWIWLNDNAGMEPGWYDDNWSPVSQNIPDAVGYLMSAGASVEVVVAGQVKAEATTVSVPKGFSIYGNNTPSSIDIQSIKLSDTAAGDGTEVIQLLDSTGQNVGNWIWLNDNAGMEPGWYDDNWSPVEYTVKSGEAFLFDNGSDDVEMTIPSAL